jgi:branched-subunit amino acid transport protein AzlD
MTMARMIAISVGVLLIIAGLIVVLMHLWVYGVVLGIIGATVITMAIRNARQDA